MNYLKFAPQNRMRMNPLFNAVLPSFFDETVANRKPAQFIPAVNIATDEKNWHIEVSAAGFKKEDFKINLENDTLTISAEQKVEGKENETGLKNYSSREFRKASFARSFTLPIDKVKVEEIVAVYENGILNVSIPKLEMVKKEFQKEIKVS